MKRIGISLSIFIPVLVIAAGMFYFKSSNKEPVSEKIIAKFIFDKGELELPNCLTTKGDYLFVTDLGSRRIQVLKINPDGSLSPKSIFGKKGDGLGEFDSPYALATKGDYLFVADTANSRIQVLEVKY